MPTTVTQSEQKLVGQGKQGGDTKGRLGMRGLWIKKARRKKKVKEVCDKDREVLGWLRGLTKITPFLPLAVCPFSISQSFAALRPPNGTDDGGVPTTDNDPQ